jgi:glycosyltransferase involved in cell wall biosynthesis
LTNFIGKTPTFAKIYILRNTLSLIIPCYNPQPLWQERVVEQFALFQNSLPQLDIRLTVVNDGATKNVDKKNLDFLKNNISLINIVHYEQNQGKGYALRQGISQSEADYYMFTDIDFPYENHSMMAVANALIAKKGIAAGFRNQNYYKKVPLFRQLLSKSFRLFIKMIGIPVEDTQCGLKGFDNAGKKIFLQTSINRYLFDFEFLYLAAKQKNIPIYHVDVQLKDGVIFTTMGLNVLKAEAWNLVKIIAKNFF